MHDVHELIYPTETVTFVKDMEPCDLFFLEEWGGIEPPNFVIRKQNGIHGTLLEVFPGLPEYGNDGFLQRP